MERHSLILPVLRSITLDSVARDDSIPKWFPVDELLCDKGFTRLCRKSQEVPVFFEVLHEAMVSNESRKR